MNSLLVLFGLAYLLILPFTGLAQESQIKIAKLSKEGYQGLSDMQEVFTARNPGYGLYFADNTLNLGSHRNTQVAFVQQGGGTASIADKNGVTKSSKVSVGDIIMLQQGETMVADSLLSLVVFTIPEKPDAYIPSFIRPDWDPNITDEPGGCATEANAYRRILLTWKKEVGEYVYHAINAHRVRIMDSFSHFHPKDIGFDEFYLVQMVLPGAKLITSEKVELISQPDKITLAQTKDLFKEYDLEVGDLVYLPRGVMHRGFGGVLAQVITVPGFIPGSELGVDHFIRQINERLGLRGADALPFNRQASAFQVIK